MKKKEWIIFIIIITLIILTLILLESTKPSMKIFANLEVTKAKFKIGETGLNFTQMLYANRILFKGAVLIIPAKEVSIGNRQMFANSNIIIKSSDTIQVANPAGTLHLKKISPEESCFLDVSVQDSLDLKFKKQASINIQGLITTDQKIVITESSGQVIRIKSNDEFPFFADEPMEITLKPQVPNFNFYLKEKETLVKLYLDSKDTFSIIKNANVSDIRFYDKESTAQPGIEFLDSTINKGKIELSAGNILGKFFLFQEYDIQSGELVTFSPNAVYFLKELNFSGENLTVNLYNKNVHEIKKGKYQDLLESIIPTWLEWVIKEPVTKKFWILVMAVTGVGFLIRKVKQQFFSGQKLKDVGNLGETVKIVMEDKKKKIRIKRKNVKN